MPRFSLFQSCCIGVSFGSFVVLGVSGCARKDASAVATSAGQAESDVSSSDSALVSAATEATTAHTPPTKTEAAMHNQGDPTSKTAPQAPNIHSYTMTRLDGTEQSLSEYAGKVLLVVNTASECGLTPQYEGLEALHKAHEGKDFAILGFPANNFGGQEPGSDAEIATFCSLNYAVTFPMFSKISVIGEDQHPLYAELSRIEGGEPTWNFTKYLIDRDGTVLTRIDSRTKPDNLELTALISNYVEK